MIAHWLVNSYGCIKVQFFFYGVHTDGTEGRDLATAVVGEIGDGGVVGDF